MPFAVFVLHTVLAVAQCSRTSPVQVPAPSLVFEDGCNLYVKNLSQSCTDLQLCTMFQASSEQQPACLQHPSLTRKPHCTRCLSHLPTSTVRLQAFGEVVSCKVLQSREGYSKCVGFVCMASRAEADACIDHLHGAQVLLPCCTCYSCSVRLPACCCCHAHRRLGQPTCCAANAVGHKMHCVLLGRHLLAACHACSCSHPAASV